jgi:tetratricopeptide (TPR) repeat protein
MLARDREAEESYGRAIERLEGLVKEQPELFEHQHHLAASHSQLAEVLRAASGRPDAAEKHFRRALAIQLELARQPNCTSEVRRELTRTYNNLGILLMDTDRTVEAAELLRRAADSLEVLVNEHSDVATYQADLARTLINIGVLSRKQNNTPEAERAYQLAISMLDQLVERHPADREYQFKSALGKLDLANLLFAETSRLTDASAYCESAKRMLSSLNELFPGIPRYTGELANVCITQANVLARLEEFAAAKQAFDESLVYLDEIHRRFPVIYDKRADFHSLRGIALGGLGYISLTNNAVDEARQLVSQAIDEQSAATNLDPLNPKYRRFLQQHYTFMAQILNRLGEDDEAGKMLRTSEQLERTEY